MRGAVLPFACLMAVLGCNLANQNDNSSDIVDKTRPTPSPTSTTSPSPAASIANGNTPVPKADLIAKLKKWEGKYPYEIKLLREPELKSRLSKLMGKDFADMETYWNVESPLTIKKNILKTTGCEQHNCGGNQYVMFVDLANDNINVYHINESGQDKTYFEKGKIALPPDFAEEVDEFDK